MLPPQVVEASRRRAPWKAGDLEKSPAAGRTNGIGADSPVSLTMVAPVRGELVSIIEREPSSMPV